VCRTVQHKRVNVMIVVTLCVVVTVTLTESIWSTGSEVRRTVHGPVRGPEGTPQSNDARTWYCRLAREDLISGTTEWCRHRVPLCFDKKDIAKADGGLTSTESIIQDNRPCGHDLKFTVCGSHFYWRFVVWGSCTRLRFGEPASPQIRLSVLTRRIQLCEVQVRGARPSHAHSDAQKTCDRHCALRTRVHVTLVAKLVPLGAGHNNLTKNIVKIW